LIFPAHARLLNRLSNATSGLAVIAVALEATVPAIVLGGIAAWMITHAT
jgi:hypothetical protein